MDIEIKKADTFLKKVKGLMFKKKIEKGLLFDLKKEKKLGASIHSFFVFTEFDAVFLDENMEIVDINKGIKPFTPLIIPEKPSRYILELPPGKTDQENLEKGKTIKSLKQQVPSKL